MKKLIFFFLLSSCFFTIKAQTPIPKFTPIHNGQAIDWLHAVQYLGVPFGDSLARNADRVGANLFFLTEDSIGLYYWNHLDSTWNKLSLSSSVSSTDTTSLSNRINLKLNISDTAAMLADYLRKIDTTGKWVHKMYKNATADSFVYEIGGSRFPFKDSIGLGSITRDTIVAGRGISATTISSTKTQLDNDSGYYAALVRDDTLVLYRYNGDSTEVTLPSGGGGSTPGLSAVTAVDSTTDTGIKIAQAAAVTKGTMTFFGNSVTAGYGLPNKSLRWTTLVSDFLGYTEKNLGLSSSTLMKRVTVDPFGATNMVDRIPLIPYFTTGSKLVFSYGLNDVRWNGANYTTANFVADYNTIIDSAIGRGWSGSDIVLISTGYIPPTTYTSYGGNPAATLARQTSFDSCVNVVATTYSALYYDAYNFMANNGARTLMQADSVHPNTQGHKVFALGFIQNYNEPVRLGGQKLAVNGQADFTAIKVSTIPTTHSKKATELVLDSAGNLAASTLRRLYYNNYRNVEIGDNADSIPYRLAVDGSGLINDGLNIYNKNATNYTKWLRLFSDYTTGESLIDAYTPLGAKATLSINSNSRGNIVLSFLGTGATTVGAGNVVIDSFYSRITHPVATGYAPARVEGLNMMYFGSGTGSIISSNSGASTFVPLSLQGFGGNTIIGGYTGQDSTLRVIGGIHGTGGVRFSGLPSNQTYSKSLGVTSNGTLFLKDTLAVSGVYAPLASPTFTGTVTAPTISLSTTVSGAGTWTAGAINTGSNITGNIFLASSGFRTANNTKFYWNSGPEILGNTNDITLKNAAATAGANVSIGTSAAEASAILDITSTAKGVLLPRMTSTQRDAISSPATGLTLFCTDCTATDASTGVMQTYNGSAWKNNW